jgi:hypothetical protein
MNIQLIRFYALVINKVETDNVCATFVFVVIAHSIHELCYRDRNKGNIRMGVDEPWG